MHISSDYNGIYKTKVNKILIHSEITNNAKTFFCKFTDEYIINSV